MSYIQNCFNSVHSKFNNVYYRGNGTTSLENDVQKAIEGSKTARIVQLIRQNPSFNFNSPLLNGELPLNYAIRTAQPVNVTRILTRNGADPLKFDDQGLNAIATAYFKGKYELLNTLILPVVKTMHSDLQKQFAQELIRNKGVNPFHYVAAIYGKEKLNSNITPEELNAVFQENLADKLNKSSPLAISKYDAAMFLTTLAWGVVNYIPVDMVHPQLMQLLQIATFSPLVFNESLLYTAIGLALSNASLISDKLTILSYLVNTMLTAKLAHSTFHGIKSCWRNFSLNRNEAIKKAVVVYAPKIAICSNQLRSLPEKFEGLWDKVHAMMLECGAYFVEIKNDFQGKMTHECSAYSGDNKTECEFRDRIRQETCSNPDLFNKCTEASDAFKKGQENNFTPNYKIWKFEDLAKHDCSQYENDNLLDCQNQHRRIVECMAESTTSSRCNDIKINFLRNLEKSVGKFDPNYEKSEFWQRMEAFRTFNTMIDCPIDFSRNDECVEKYTNWQAECKNDFYSQKCLDAEEALRKASNKISFWSSIFGK
jgi:hypothetical protein